MRDTLKEYIDEHRAELDVAVPSDKLWTNIEKAMIVAIPTAGVTSSIPWLKYFAFGLSSVAAAAVVYSLATTEPAPVAEIIPIAEPVPAPAIQVNSAPVTPSVTPAPATDFILQNAVTAVPLPPEENFAFLPVITRPVAQDTIQPITETIAPLAPITLSDSVFTGIRRVEVIASSVNMIVKGTDGTAVNTALKEVENVVTNIDYKRTDTLLQITVKTECTKKIATQKGFVIMSGSTADPELTVNVPSGTSVVLRNTHGEIKVSNITAPVCDVHSSSGDIHLASITAFTTVESTHGDLDARAVTGNLTAHLSSGNVDAAGIRGNVDVTSTHGDHTLSDITGNLRVMGSSGNIDVTNLVGDMDAKTTHGDIHITGFKGSAHLVSSSGNIIGNKIELTANSTFITTHGDLKMTLINSLETLSFELNTSHGEILVDKNGEQFREESKLMLTRGAILIKATSSSGDQVFR